jgi:predicted Zn-dependent protease
LPGGKVAIYEGIVPLCENEAGLAVVMSHEIAHALARHGAERMSQQAGVQGA